MRGRWREESAGLEGFSSHLHRQYAHESQGTLQAGQFRPCADGSPQRLPVDWTITCYAALACRDSAPQHCVEGQWNNLESGSGSTHKGCRASFELGVYESFNVLEALPTRWSPIHLFKCNCSTCFTHASCAHVLYGMLQKKSKSPCNMSV